MFNSLRSKFVGLPVWLQVALVLLAGAASFTLSLNMAPRRADATVDAQAMMAKPMRGPASASPAEAPTTATPPEGPASVAAPRRLTPGIVQNPFAPLNLQASMGKPVVVATVQPKPAPKAPPPAPQAPPVSQVAPPPTAPPLPFVVIGAIRGQGIADGKPVVFLNERGNALVVSQGDDIHGTYKVEAISSDSIEFTYLPLGQRQSLSLAK